MIAIVNVSPQDAPMVGVNNYEVRINRKVICTFEHNRSHDGLAQCLRDAADAVDVQSSKDAALREEMTLNMLTRII